MDDPTRRCENDTDNRTRYSGALVPKQGPHFFAYLFLRWTASSVPSRGLYAMNSGCLTVFFSYSNASVATQLRVR